MTTKAAKLNSKERQALRDRYRRFREATWADREPLHADECKSAPSLLELMACAGENPRDLLYWLPARYDSHWWYADTLPERRKLREAVQFAIRRRGYTQVPPKIVDAVVTRIIDRAKKRGPKPHCEDCRLKNPRPKRDGLDWLPRACSCSDYCYCPSCVARMQRELDSLGG